MPYIINSFLYSLLSHILVNKEEDEVLIDVSNIYSCGVLFVPLIVDVGEI